MRSLLILRKIKSILIVIIVIIILNCGNKNQPEKSIKDISPLENANILLITIDTLRYDRLGIYDRKYVKTPNIDALANKSQVFTRAFAHNPVTLPSHVNILTGLTPLYHGISDNSGFKLEERFLTIAEFFKEKSYSTGAFIGAFPLDSRFGLAQGFDIYDESYGYSTDVDFFFNERPAEKVIASAVKWISSRDGKWFSWVHLFDPHQHYSPPPPYDNLYKTDLYSGEVAYIDEQLGILFKLLENKGLMDNTVIAFTSDHGEGLGEKGEGTHSYFAYNSTIHIPLILYIPGIDSKLISENVCHVDIFPSLCELLGFDFPPRLQGESLIHIINGGKRKNKEIYFESLTPFLNRGWAPLRGFIRGDLKYIDLPVKEVYDLKVDIDENRNLAKEKNLGRLKKDLFSLVRKLKKGKEVKRDRIIDIETRKRMESLGYISESVRDVKRVFTKKDDLKELLPLHEKMIISSGKYMEGDVEGAIRGLKEVLTESPTFINVYSHLGSIYKDINKIGEAVKILRRGLENNPGSSKLLSRLGIILAEHGNATEAIKLLNKAIITDSYNPENFNFLGFACFKNGDINSALDNYNKALELDNNMSTVFNNIGTVYLTIFLRTKNENAFNTALKNFNRSIEIDPGLHEAYNGRGAAYKFRNKLDLAIKDWKKTIELQPDFIDAYFNLSVTLIESGRKKEALEYLYRCKNNFISKLGKENQGRLFRLINEAMQ